MHRKSVIGATSGAFAVALVAVLVGQSAPVLADANTNLSLTASVSVNCTISTQTLAFGGYDPVVTHASANLDGQGTVTIACTKGSVTPIDLDLGSNETGTTRRLADGSNYLSYELYQNAGRTTVWGEGAAGVTPSAAPDRTARDFNVYGRIAGGQDVPEGSYADTVNATVNF